MKTIWTKNLKTEEEAEHFNNSLRGSKIVLDRLYQLLDEKDQELDRSQKSMESYESPNWELKTAHKNGYSSALSHIKNLISLDPQSKTNQ